MINRRKALLTLFLIFVRPNNDPARASPSCVLYRPAYLGKVSLQNYSAWSIGRLYCLIIVTRKVVISYRATVLWFRTNRRQVEMFSVKETKACPTLLFLLTHVILIRAMKPISLFIRGYCSLLALPTVLPTDIQLSN